MLTLFHSPRSRSSRIVWLLEELNTPYKIEYVTISRMMDGSGGPDAKNPHPDKKVPALVHDGVLITESIALCLYLTDQFPEAGIGPRVGDPRRGPYLSWLAYYAGVIEPVITVQFAELLDNPIFKGTWRGREAMDARIVDALKAGPYILGERFSAVDILIASMGQWMRTMLPADAIVDEYLARCGDRPALARAAAKDAG